MPQTPLRLSLFRRNPARRSMPRINAGLQRRQGFEGFGALLVHRGQDGAFPGWKMASCDLRGFLNRLSQSRGFRPGAFRLCIVTASPAATAWMERAEIIGQPALWE